MQKNFRADPTGSLLVMGLTTSIFVTPVAERLFIQRSAFERSESEFWKLFKRSHLMERLRVFFFIVVILPGRS
jgi:hypothetical protein